MFSKTNITALIVSASVIILFFPAPIFTLAQEKSEQTARSKKQSSMNITTEIIKNIAQNPQSIGKYINTGTEDEVAELIILVIIELQTMEIEDGVIRTRVGIMLSETTKIRGAAFGSAVMMRIRKKVNPRLLPIIPVGGNISPPPSPSPKYRRQ